MEIEEFNRTINIWINELSRFTLSQLLIKPDPNSWSLGQVYNHLIEETTWFNAQVQLTLGNERNSEKTTSDAAVNLFKRGAFEDKRIQGDPLISENVRQPTTKAELKQGLEQLKEDTSALWIKMNTSSKMGKSQHPGFGFLNGYEWIRYSEMHMRHHLKQKERIELFLKSIDPLPSKIPGPHKPTPLQE